MIGNILLTILLVLTNAFFVATEFAIVKVRSSQLRVRIKSGSRLALLAQHIVIHLDAYLSVTQLGITLASLGLGWIGEPVVGKLILMTIDYFQINITPEMAQSLSLPFAFALITVLHIVLGELVPKSLAILYPEQCTIIASVPLKIMYTVFKPFIFVLNSLANFIVKLLGFKPPKESESPHSTEEIRMILEESTKSGEIEDAEHVMLDNIFDFSDTPVKQIMVPRNRIVAADSKSSIDEILDMIIEDGYSRIPIYRNDIDDIVGIIYGKDLLTLIKNINLIVIEDLMRKPLFFSEEEKIDNVLKRMQVSHFHFAIVYNEFGGTAGIVTLEDILEEIVGEIQDEHDDEMALVEAVSDEYFEISASLGINDANDFLPMPLPENEDYETVGGYILSLIGRIPNENEVLHLGNYTFFIVSASNRKIEKIQITYIKLEEEEKD